MFYQLNIKQKWHVRSCTVTWQKKEKKIWKADWRGCHVFAHHCKTQHCHLLGTLVKGIPLPIQSTQFSKSWKLNETYTVCKTQTHVHGPSVVVFFTSVGKRHGTPTEFQTSYITKSILCFMEEVISEEVDASEPAAQCKLIFCGSHKTHFIWVHCSLSQFRGLLHLIDLCTTLTWVSLGNPASTVSPV